MKIAAKSTVAQMHGALTHQGVSNNIVKSLAVSLKQAETAGTKSMHIDCRKVCSADTNGLQLLYVWIQCAKFRGVHSILVNLPDCLQQSMMNLGFEDCIAR
jgi:ABC-type transporter Mla MlaB component